jgi:hypothetical protein
MFTPESTFILLSAHILSLKAILQLNWVNYLWLKELPRTSYVFPFMGI